MFSFYFHLFDYSNIYAIDTNNVISHINYLASDNFEGRAPGTLGGYLSAKYLAYYYDKYGLIPIGDDDTYYQNINMHTIKVKDNTVINLLNQDKTYRELKLNQDFLLFKYGKKTNIPQFTSLVFVGYGISAPEFDYNDYNDINVDNKVVVFLEGEPYSTNDAYFNGSKSSKYSNLESKYRNAISKGAIGVLVIPEICNFDYNTWQKLQKEHIFPSINTAQMVTNTFAAYVNLEFAKSLLLNENFEFNSLCELHITGKIRSFTINKELNFKGQFEEYDYISPNIIGMVVGNDQQLKDEYIIVTAHYDHLGKVINNIDLNDVNLKEDIIYNGATDNALGVAALLEIAKDIISSKKNKRSIIFLLTTGEEFGLLGSGYYCQFPAKPLNKTKLNINIDGVAFYDMFKEIVTIGDEHSNLDEIIFKVANINNLSIGQIPNNFQNNEAYRLSDNYTFLKLGIPSLLVLEGTEYVNKTKNEAINFLINYSENIYHTPKDDLSIKINYKAVNLHSEIIKSIIIEAANSKNEIEILSGSPYRNSYLRLNRSGK